MIFFIKSLICFEFAICLIVCLLCYQSTSRVKAVVSLEQWWRQHLFHARHIYYIPCLIRPNRHELFQKLILLHLFIWLVLICLCWWICESITVFGWIIISLNLIQILSPISWLLRILFSWWLNFFFYWNKVIFFTISFLSSDTNAWIYYLSSAHFLT